MSICLVLRLIRKRKAWASDFSALKIRVPVMPLYTLGEVLKGLILDYS